MDANVVTAPLERGGPTISPWEMVVTLLDANVVTVRPLKGGWSHSLPVGDSGDVVLKTSLYSFVNFFVGKSGAILANHAR